MHELLQIVLICGRVLILSDIFFIYATYTFQSTIFTVDVLMLPPFIIIRSKILVPLLDCCKSYQPSLISHSFMFARRSCRGGILTQQSEECPRKSRMRKPKGKRLVIFLTLLHSALMFSSGSSWEATSYRRYIFAKRNNLLDLDAIFSFPASHSHLSPSVGLLSTFLFLTLESSSYKLEMIPPLCMPLFLVTCKFCCMGG
jgi:hypothetical protein